MAQSFSTLAILSMVFNVLAGIAVPILLVVLIKKKNDMRIGPLFVGACAYIAANMFLQGIVDTLIGLAAPLANFLAANAKACAVIMAVLHGVIQLGGYYLIIHMFMKDFRRKENSLLFGVGIRIIDSIMLYGVNSGVMSLSVAFSINKSGIDGFLGAYEAGSAEAEEVRTTILEMVNTPLIEIAGTGIICIALIFISIAISVLLFQAAKRPGKMYLLPTAGIIGIANCLLAEFYSARVITGIGTFIVLLILLAAASCTVAYFVYKNDTDEERGKADIVTSAQTTAPGETSIREKIARVNKSSVAEEK